MSRRVVNALNQMPERNRFIRGLRAWAGFRQIGIPYNRAARAAGTPKYTFGKLIQLALDGLISFQLSLEDLCTYRILYFSIFAGWSLIHLFSTNLPAVFRINWTWACTRFCNNCDSYFIHGRHTVDFPRSYW